MPPLTSTPASTENTEKLKEINIKDPGKDASMKNTFNDISAQSMLAADRSSVCLGSFRSRTLIIHMNHQLEPENYFVHITICTRYYVR